MLDVSLVFFVLAVAAAAATGVAFRPGEWYARLVKPSWTPPDRAFPIVWTMLYVMIALAGWLVWRNESGNVAIVFWGLQLVLNALWSYLFFGARRTDLALADIMLLLLAAVAFMIAAWPVSQAASLLFVPYVIWIAIAAALNRSIRHLNPGI